MRVLSWYLPPGQRDDVLRQVEQRFPVQGPPLFTGGDLNYHVPAPAEEELVRAQQVRGILAQRLSMCVEFGGHTHRPSGDSPSQPRQLDAISVPAAAIGKWSVSQQWTHGLSDHAAIVASLHRRQAADSGVLSTALIRSMPPAALTDLRNRFSFLERTFNTPRWSISAVPAQGFIPPN